MEEVEDQENVPNFYQKKNKKQELDFVQVLDYIDVRVIFTITTLFI